MYTVTCMRTKLSLAAAAKVRRFSSRTKVRKGLVAVRKVRRFNGAKVRRLHGHTKVQRPGGGSVALGAMVQRIRAPWFSAFVRCGSALIPAASSVAGWVH